MGPIQWVQEMSFSEDDSPDERRRKALVVPASLIFGAGAVVWILVTIPYFVRFTEYSQRFQVRYAVYCASMVLAAGALLPAGIRSIVTRRLSRRQCELPVLGCAVAVIMQDGAAALSTERSFVFINVLVLDVLLVCGCRAGTARAVVVATVVWMLIRAVLDTENLSGTRETEVVRFSFAYFRSILANYLAAVCVFVADFHFTRGFATSMVEQRALVEASVRVSEVAAVLLSRYQTDETLELLRGPERDQLPPMLHSALLQLAENLALYRPYLPQSCLPSADDSDTEDSSFYPSASGQGQQPQPDQCNGGEAASSCSARNPSWASSSASSRQSGAGRLSVGRRVSDAAALKHGAVLRLAGRESSSKRVSLVAVNSRGFLNRCSDRHWTATFVRGEVEGFTGAVAAERGVVDVVSGDHLFANFNATRMCTTHRVSAARVLWAAAADTKRTGAACSGSILCGDFGTSEVRRFMVLGAALNTLHCLERVAAQQRMLLVDEVVGGDADVCASFFCTLMERLTFEKRTKPFLVWRLADAREVTDGPEEWMYELAGQASNPYQEWNEKLLQWLEFGDPIKAADAERMRRPFAVGAFTEQRVQSRLHEAGVSGSTLVFPVVAVGGDLDVESVL